MRSWGATPAETTRAFEKVWPWLVQLGLGRGGWYSWDWLESEGRPSAVRIESEWQELEVGQHLYRVPKGPTNRWTVVILEPNRTLVLRTKLRLVRPVLRFADRYGASDIRGRDLGLLPA